LPAAGISSSGLLLVAFPLTFAVRLHGLSEQGPRLLLFRPGDYLGGRHGGLFCRPCCGQASVCADLSPKKTWEGAVAGFVGSLLVGLAFTRWLNAPPVHLLAWLAQEILPGKWAICSNPHTSAVPA